MAHVEASFLCFIALLPFPTIQELKPEVKTDCSPFSITNLEHFQQKQSNFILNLNAVLWGLFLREHDGIFAVYLVTRGFSHRSAKKEQNFKSNHL